MLTVVVVLVAALFMILLERLAGARQFRRVAGWWPRALLLNAVQMASVYVGVLSWDRWFPALGVDLAAAWSLPAQVAAGYLLITFVYYWWHRARHEVPVLWRWFHQVHHSPARIEIITSFYKHPLEILANGALSSFLLYVGLGVSAKAAAITVLITGLAELFYHWNVRTPYWLGFIFQRPESHCVHHRAGYHRNNYSDLPLWDLLFGTFENPREQPENCGFTAQRERSLGAMLLGRDVHRNQGTETQQ